MPGAPKRRGLLPHREVENLGEHCRNLFFVRLVGTACVDKLLAEERFTRRSNHRSGKAELANLAREFKRGRRSPGNAGIHDDRRDTLAMVLEQLAGFVDGRGPERIDLPLNKPTVAVEVLLIVIDQQHRQFVIQYITPPHISGYLDQPDFEASKPRRSNPTSCKGDGRS